MILGIIGAVGGTILGALGGWAAAEYADLPLTYPFEWFAIAVGVGVLVGIISGLYPAWRAARTDPIEALRYDRDGCNCLPVFADPVSAKYRNDLQQSL